MSRPFPRTALTALLTIVSTVACGGDLPAPTTRDAVSPHAPEASFDPGPNPLATPLSPTPGPSSSGGPSVAGHGHGGMPGMDMPSAAPSPSPSASASPSPPGKPR